MRAPCGRRACVAVAVALSLLLAPVTRSATPEEEAAKDLYQAGRKLFKQSRYRQALAKLELAWGLHKHDSVAYYLGRTHAALGQCEYAIRFLTKLRGKLTGKAETDRLRDEAGCRWKRVRAAMKAFRCKDARADLRALDERSLPSKTRRALPQLSERVDTCVHHFETSDRAGQQAARLHSTAMERLAAKDLAGAASYAERSLAARPSVPARWVRAVALAEQGKCGEALPLLESVAGKLSESEQKRGRADETQCLFAEARRAVAKGACRAAMPLLKRLAGRLGRRDETWRTNKAAWCAPRITEFPTHTVERRSAYKLFLAARESIANGQFVTGIKRYENALAMADEPLIRRELATLYVVGKRCDEAQSLLAGIPATARVPADEELVKRCEGRAPPPPERDPVPDPRVTSIGPAKRPPPSSPPPQSSDTTAGWTLFGVGAAVAISGAIFGGFYADAAASVEHKGALYERRWSEYATATELEAIHNDAVAAQDAAESYSIAAWVLGGIGLAAVAVGLVLLIAGDDATDDAGATHVSGLGLCLHFAPGSIGVGGRF